MNQASLYEYNQRTEILAPVRRGTSYYGPNNYRPLVIYRGLNADLDFYVKDSDRKPNSLHNKTYTANIVDNKTKQIILQRKLIPTNYDIGLMVLKLNYDDTSNLSEKKYDLIITYTRDNESGSYAAASDQTTRISLVLDVRSALFSYRHSQVVLNETVLRDRLGENEIGGNNDRLGLGYVGPFRATPAPFVGNNPPLLIGSRMDGPAMNNNKSGVQTAVVYFHKITGFIGNYRFQGTLNIQPSTDISNDWFDIPGQSHGDVDTHHEKISYHTFVGNYMFVRMVITLKEIQKDITDVDEVIKIDKLIYRS